MQSRETSFSQLNNSIRTNVRTKQNMSRVLNRSQVVVEKIQVSRLYFCPASSSKSSSSMISNGGRLATVAVE